MFAIFLPSYRRRSSKCVPRLSEERNTTRRSALFVSVFACLLPFHYARAADMHITLLGTGGPSSGAFRGEAGLLVEAGSETLLFDCGSTVPSRLDQLFPSKIGVSKVFLSHLHSDHTEGLPMLWMQGWQSFRWDSPLFIWGPGPDVDQPSGTADLASRIQAAYATNTHIRRDLVEHLPPDGSLIRATEVSEGVVYQSNGVTVTAFLVDHHPVKPAYGYRIDYAGRSVVFSGDTTRSDNLIKFAKGADVLIHEVILPPPGAGQGPITQYHTTPEQAADVFRRVAPRLAVYTHIVGPDGAALNLINRTRAAGYTGRLEVGQDFMSIDVSDTITVNPCPSVANPAIDAITDGAYGNNIRPDGTIVVWGSNFSPTGGNSIVAFQGDSDPIFLGETTGTYFWDQSAIQINAGLGGKLTAGQAIIAVRNACGVISNSAAITIN
jgi:ribonuclease Z